jgi:hypothetical protein
MNEEEILKEGIENVFRKLDSYLRTSFWGFWIFIGYYPFLIKTSVCFL